MRLQGAHQTDQRRAALCIDSRAARWRRNRRLPLADDSLLADAYVGVGVIIAAAERVEIGSDALIAANVTIRDQDHGTDPDGPPYRLQTKQTAPIRIGDNVWLGAGVAVLKGVAIGNHCVVGANSVVTRSLPAGSRAVGAPARPIS